MDEKTTNRLIDGLYAAYNRGDADGAVSEYAQDGQHADIAQGNLNEGRQAIREGLMGFLGAFPDANWNEERRIVAPDAAAVAYRLTGTLQKKLGPFEAKGQQLDIRGVHLLVIGEGGITRSEDYWDGRAFQIQMSQDPRS